MNGFSYGKQPPKPRTYLIRMNRSPVDCLKFFFPVPGVVEKEAGSDLEFTSLVSTGAAGTISFEQFSAAQGNSAQIKQLQGLPGESRILAARIRGSNKNADDGDDEERSQR